MDTSIYENFFFSTGVEGGDGLSSQGVSSEPSRIVSQWFLSTKHCVLGITPQCVLSSANYRPQWLPLSAPTTSHLSCCALWASHTGGGGATCVLGPAPVLYSPLSSSPPSGRWTLRAKPAKVSPTRGATNGYAPCL